MSIDVDILEQLMPNVLTVVTQLCASGLLCFLMYKLGYKPVKKILDARKEFENQTLEKAIKLKEENETINNQKQEIISEAKKEAQTIVDNAKLEGEKVKDNLINEAKSKAKQILNEANGIVDAERNKMLKQTKADIVDMVIETSEKLLNKELSKDVTNDVDAFLRDLDSHENWLS